jgi:uncharacterized protein YbbC (DUF1343 family)
MRVKLGLERLLDAGSLKGRRVGLVSNPASVDGDLRQTANRLAADPDIHLKALFGPQHGFHSDVQDNMVETRDGYDQIRQVPVYSLYGDTREPTADMLRGLDVLVVDLQDVGCRVYTFAYTMAHCLTAARRHGLGVLVCDRPNPIGGTAVEGPLLERGFESFVGMYPIPMRHGLTMGELARLFNDEFAIGAKLEVIPMEGWRRDMYLDDTGLPWVMPSPNMPTLDTAIVYPGTVLFEGTTVSEGRGTTRPFEIVGAPWVTGERLADAMNRLNLPGVFFRPVMFEPTFQKHARLGCGGCQIHVLDRARFRPVKAAVALMCACRASDPDRFRWRDPPYEYEYEKLPIDILWGSTELREAIDSGQSVDDIARSWDAGLDGFTAIREKYRLY